MTGELITVAEARSQVLGAVRGLPREAVPVAEALGRVLAEDLIAEIELPPFDSSAMDGFAVASGDGGELPVVGESQAGAPFEGRMSAGEAVRISTGAVIPTGCGAVVPLERVETVGGDAGAARIRVPPTRPGLNIRRAGEDVRAGDLVARAGAELGPAELGMLAALGRIDVACARRPRVAIAATGDELRQPGEPLAPGQIYDSNAIALSALVARAGAEVVVRARIRDDAAATAADIDRIAHGTDVVLIAGGVSVGPHDHVRPALQALGFEQRFWGVSLKPGKPLWFGVRDGQYAFGLPGNPVSAMVTFTLFARPLLRALQGAPAAAQRSTAILGGPIRANAERDQAVRCRLSVEDDGWHAQPTGPQGSHVISSMIGAGALAIVPAGERDCAPGDRVAIELL